MVLGLIGFSLFILVVGGALLAIYNWTRVRRLEQSAQELKLRLAKLEERGVRERPAEPVEKVAAPSPAGVQTPAPTLPPIEPIPSAPAKIDLETLVAGRWLNRVAIVALLMAAAFFLKFAFDNDWIGPMGRVAIGLIAGSGLLVASQWLLGRGYRYFSEGIAALGGGVLFLSLYAAWSFYSLISHPVAFSGMVVVTAALAGLALGRDSQRLAVLALMAGLVTPGLLDTGVDPQLARFSYIAILVAGSLLLAWRRSWRWLAPIALAGFLVYLIDWADSFYTADKLGITLFFVSLFFLEFAAFLLLRARSRSALGLEELLLIPANGTWYGIALFLLLYQEHRWWLTIAVLVVGTLHLVAATFLRQTDGERALAARLVFAGLALTFATAAIPIRLEGEWITIAWALEGALLIWAGFRSGIGALRAAGMVLFVAVIGLLLSQSGVGARLFFNERFASFAAAVVAFAVSGVWARANWHEIESEEQRIFLIMGIAVSGLVVWGLSEEVWSFLGRQQWNLDPGLAQQMGLSLLWVAAAGVLVFLGVRRRSSALRWQGLALMGLVIGKVFLLDLSFLERAYRIASFLVLGVVLLAVSFWYQRNLAGSLEDGQSEDETPE
jgi:uncharacterized membrane protein